MKTKLLLTTLCSFLLLQTYATGPLQLNGTKSTDWTMLEDCYMNDSKISNFIYNDNDNYYDTADKIEIYNEDLTLYKSLDIEALAPEAIGFAEIVSYKMGDKYFCTTQTLFNDDDLLEFIVVGEGFFSIINENGVVLTKEVFDSPHYFKLFEMSAQNYIVVESDNNMMSCFYLITKGNNSDLKSVTLSKVTSFPNPAKDYINIGYDLQGATTGNITISNLSGKMMDKISISSEQKLFRYSTTKLNPGTYVVSVEANGQQLSSEKIIVK